MLGFFLDFAWPGNVRQLKHCLESAMNFVSDKDLFIQRRHLPAYLFSENVVSSGAYRQKETIAEPISHLPEQKKTGIFSAIIEKEKMEIINALMGNQGNVSKNSQTAGDEPAVADLPDQKI